MIAIDLVEYRNVHQTVFAAYLGGRMVQSPRLTPDEAKDFDQDELARILAIDCAVNGYKEPKTAQDFGLAANVRRIWLTAEQAAEWASA